MQGNICMVCMIYICKEIYMIYVCEEIYIYKEIYICIYICKEYRYPLYIHARKSAEMVRWV